MDATNIAAIVMISFATNTTENIHQDGTRKTVVETVKKQCVHEWIEGRQTHNHTNVTTHKETIKRYRRVWEPIETTPAPTPPTPPVPSGVTFHLMDATNAINAPSVLSNVMSRAVMFQPAGAGDPLLLAGRFSAPVPPPDDCIMFSVDFPTEANHIYRFEGSQDLVGWQYLQPEIDGTGSPDTFYDSHQGMRAYRVVSREGVLPEE